MIAGIGVKGFCVVLGQVIVTAVADEVAFPVVKQKLTFE
jgi:hypothetical protein